MKNLALYLLVIIFNLNAQSNQLYLYSNNEFIEFQTIIKSPVNSNENIVCGTKNGKPLVAFVSQNTSLLRSIEIDINVNLGIDGLAKDLEINDVILDGNNLVAVGNLYNGTSYYAFVLSFNLLNETLNWDYYCGQNMQFRGISIMDDGRYFIVGGIRNNGYYPNISTGMFRKLIAVLSNDGSNFDIIQTYANNILGSNFASSSDHYNVLKYSKGYYVIGRDVRSGLNMRPHISKFYLDTINSNTEIQEVFEHFYLNNISSTARFYGRALCAHNDQIVFCGNGNSNGTAPSGYKGFIGKIDTLTGSNVSIVKEYSFTGYNQVYFMKIIQFDNYYYSFGFAKKNGTNKYSGLILKYDENLNLLDHIFIEHDTYDLYFKNGVVNNSFLNVVGSLNQNSTSGDPESGVLVEMNILNEFSIQNDCFTTIKPPVNLSNLNPLTYNSETYEFHNDFNNTTLLNSLNSNTVSHDYSNECLNCPEIYINTLEHLNIICDSNNIGRIAIDIMSDTVNKVVNWISPDGQISNDITIDSLSPGNYQLSIEDSITGCRFDTIYTIQQSLPLTGDFSIISVPSCLNNGLGSIQLSLDDTNGPFNISCLDSLNVQSGIVDNSSLIINSLAPGDYNINIVNSQSCNLNINLNLPGFNYPSLIIDSIFDSKCFNDNTGAIYLSSFPDNNILYTLFENNNFITNSNVGIFEQLNAGGYKILLLDSLTGCSDSSSFIIMEPEEIQISIETDSIICAGDTIQILVNANGGTGSFVYSINQETYQSISEFYWSPNSDTVNIQVMDDNMCVKEKEFEINYIDSLNYTITSSSQNQSICIDDVTSLILNNVQSVDSVSFNWTNENDLILSTDSLLEITVSNDTLIFFNIQNQCYTETDTFHFYPIDIMEPVFFIDTLSECNFGNFSVQLDNINPNLLYYWNLSNQTSYINNEIVNIDFFIDECVSLELNIISTDGNCAKTYNYSNFLCSLPNPNADFSFEINNDNNNHIVQYYNQSEYSNQYQWIFDNSNTTNIIHPSELYETDTEFELETILIAKDSLTQCADTVVKTIYLSPDFKIYVPNSFHPNEKYNFIFKPKYFPYIKEGSYKLNIFDRWGTLVFESINPEMGWDGTLFNGKVAKEGVYVWKITLKTPQGKLQNLKGHLLLIR